MSSAVPSGSTVREGTAGRYVWLWLFGLAVGWFEASVVVYLRQLYYPRGFHFPVLITWDRVVAVEVTREVASILLLAAGARLAGRQFLERFAAFLLLFGIWDLVYYGVLKIVLGWPEGLGTWDVLFLIPTPWVGPVWAPFVVSVALLGAGTYLYWTADRARRIRPLDWSVEILAGLIVISSFLAESRAVIEARIPEHFPAWLFWVGWAMGLAWFIRAERSSQQRVRYLPTSQARAG
ncbi:MAG TPA: hypothetical protein VKI41_08500 [Vicinamibacteria bacterium]|nr:hypothetical protein [Vicinamibacteria bacterium]